MTKKSMQRRRATRSKSDLNRALTAALSVAFGIVTALGCGPAERNDDQPTPPGATSSEQAFADALVSAFCEGLAACCSSRARALETTICETKIRSIVAGRATPSDDVRFDQGAADQCLTNVRATLSTCAGVELEPCDRVYVGTLAAGQACDRNDECAPVEGTSTYCQGVCKAARREAVGGSCVRTCRAEDDCFVLPGEPAADVVNKAAWGECFTEDGLACVGGSCVRAPAGGVACLAGSFCDRGLGCVNGVCAPLPAVGEVCTRNCAPGAACSGTGVCRQALSAGSPCAEDEECASGKCGRDACTAESCPSACQSPTLGPAHGAAQECAGTVHL
jgi:hypothetical protein